MATRTSTMPDHTPFTIPRNAAAVKPRERRILFARYHQFCDTTGLDAPRYPILPRTLRAFCRSIGIGKKSRKARRQRGVIRDVLSGPARAHAGVPPKAGPPKGPADNRGRREYHTLDACRRGGIKSGAVRRHRNRSRDATILDMVLTKGHTRREAAVALGVSLRTVYYVLARDKVTRAAEAVRRHPYKKDATNILRQAQESVGYTPGAPVAVPVPPMFARAAVALKLFWRQAARRPGGSCGRRRTPDSRPSRRETSAGWTGRSPSTGPPSAAPTPTERSASLTPAKPGSPH